MRFVLYVHKHWVIPILPLVFQSAVDNYGYLPLVFTFCTLCHVLAQWSQAGRAARSCSSRMSVCLCSLSLYQALLGHSQPAVWGGGRGQMGEKGIKIGINRNYYCGPSTLRHFEIYCKNVLYFHQNFIDVPTDQLVSIGSVYGLAPNRWQSVTWTSNDIVRRYIYASIGLSEFIQSCHISRTLAIVMWWFCTKFLVNPSPIGQQHNRQKFQQHFLENINFWDCLH